MKKEKLLLKKRERSNDSEWDKFSITIKTNNKKDSKFEYDPIEERYNKSINDYLNKSKTIDKIINNNNIYSDINYLYLKNTKKKNNFEYLKESLKNSQYISLFKDKRNNPLDSIIEFLESLIENENSIPLIKNANFIGYNLPFIYGIERVRINYYLWLLKEKIKNNSNPFSKILKDFNYYFQYLKRLNKQRKNNICEEDKINLILYQFILEITEVIYPCNTFVGDIPTIYNKINTEFIELKDKNNNSIIEGALTINNYLKKINNEKYELSNGHETIYISEKNYNLQKLANDIKLYPYYPLNLLLYRNESINFYYESGKNFIERESEDLFNSFKNYFFEFIKSKNCIEIFSKKIYHNIKEIIEKEKNIRKILLNEFYLKFLPFYINQFSGYTNKDILLSVVSAYPSIIKLLPQNYSEKNYKDIKHFCLLMAIGEKFITILHEQSIHFLYGYLYHMTKVEGMNISPKKIEKGKKDNEDKDNSAFEDGGYLFESELFGHVISKLTITNVIALFDGKAIQNTNDKFKKIFNNIFDAKYLKTMIESSSGFLNEFLKKFPIDFDFIFSCVYTNKPKDLFISGRGAWEPYIEIPIYNNKDLHLNPNLITEKQNK